MNKRFLSLAAVGAVAMSGTIARATVTPTYSEYAGTGDIVVPVSNSDLLQIAGTTVAITSGDADTEGTNNPAVLSDGQFTTTNPQMFTPHTNAVVTFVLSTTGAPNGYDISSIATYSGWNDSGRDDQDVTVAYSTVSNPTDFSNVVGTARYTPANADGGKSASQALFSTSLSNVAALQFTFGPQENGHEGYGEIDAIGTASATPEPASLATLGISAAIGLLGRRRRGFGAA